MKRVLVMDDDASVLEMLKEALVYENFDVKTLLAPGNIFDVIAEYHPDLILIDYLIPEINGGELCHQIKSKPDTSHLPVIIISGYPRVFTSLGDYGCDAFIEKPFDLSDLIKAINTVTSLNP